MTDSSPPLGASRPRGFDAVERLDSWKEIASYLGRTVRTAQRWEKLNGLPVRRQRHEAGMTVFAYRHELDAWLEVRAAELEDDGDEEEGEDGAGRETPPSGAEDTAPKPSRQRRSIGPRLLGLVAAGLAGGALAFFLLRPSPSTPPTEAEPATGPLWLTTSSGIERFPTLSPDGRQLAYIWDADHGQADLYLQLVGATGPPLRLTRGPETEEGPAWSPDGLSIAFLRRSDRPGERTLWVVPALGGVGRQIAGFSVSVTLDFSRIIDASVAWAPDGLRIAATDEGAAPDSFGIVAVDVERGERMPLSDPPAGAIDAQPVFSADGRRLAFVRSSVRNRWVLCVLDLEADGRPAPNGLRILEQAGERVSRPAWTPDGRELVYGLGVWGSSSLWRIAADGSSPPRRLAGVGLGGAEPTLSPMPGATGAGPPWRLVYAARELDNDIWRQPLPGPVGEPIRERERLITSSQRERFPAYSPDGSRIVFASDRSGHRDYWVADADGAAATQWTEWNSAWVGYPSWSPDGSQLAYAVRIGETTSLFVQDGPLQAARPLEVPGVPGGVAWARRGSTVYVNVNREGEDPGIWAVDARGESAARQVTAKGARPLGEDPARGFLYFELNTASVRDLARVDLAAPDPTTSLEVLVRDTLGGALGPDGLYFVTQDEEGFALRRRRFGGETVELVVGLEDEPERGIAISPDGRFLLFSRIGLERSDLLLVDDLR